MAAGIAHPARVLRSCASGGVKLHLHRVTNFEEKHTRVFHPPPHIRNLKRSLRAPGASSESYFDGESNFVLRTMHGKQAVNLKYGGASRGEGAFGVIGAEEYLRIAPALNYLLVHFVVTRAVTSLAAGGVERDFSAGLAGCGIELNVAALQQERAPHRVQVAGEGNIGPASRRVELQPKFMGRRWRLRDKGGGDG